MSPREYQSLVAMLLPSAAAAQPAVFHRVDVILLQPYNLNYFNTKFCVPLFRESEDYQSILIKKVLKRSLFPKPRQSYSTQKYAFRTQNLVLTKTITETQCYLSK